MSEFNDKQVKAINRVKKYVNRIVWGITLILQSEYVREFGSFVKDNLGLIVKTVLTAEGGGGTGTDKFNFAFMEISENANVSAGWINLAIELVLIVTKALVRD